MEILGTTIIAVLKNGRLAMAGDGQVTLGNQVLKSKAKKVRRIYNNTVLGGFAGHTADALTLFERFEARLSNASGNLKRAAVDLTKEWRTDRALRRLEAMMLVGDTTEILIVSGQGDVIDPDEPIAAIGSGAPMAISAAKALWKYSNMSAEEIAKASIEIASEICIYTNQTITLEVL
ncbi:MAG: ATP-dependent protease subunit HslV [Candidatus Riflebacteria bacterium]|nr:ATP-dependent protease subunit HslV [Candidatus Riflebacteria bacterium]